MRNKIYFLYRILRTALTPAKIYNAVRSELSYRLSKMGVLTSWKISPLFASIEPVNICNLHCPECPVGMRDTTVKATHITPELTKKLIDELAPTLMHAILYFQGEPLISKNFTEMVRYARSKNILTSTSTNGQLLNDALARDIVESGLDKLIVSIDGATQETYEAYRVGGKLEKVTRAVELINKWKKELNRPSPFVEIQFIVFKTNEHELDEMKALSKKLGADKLSFKTAQLYDFEDGNPLLTSIEKYARYELRDDGKYHIKSKLHNHCRRLWQGSVLSSRGDLLPCCFDKDSEFAFGNLNNDSFADIHHSEQAQKFRRAILDNRKQFEMCRNCTSK